MFRNISRSNSRVSPFRKEYAQVSQSILSTESDQVNGLLSCKNLSSVEAARIISPSYIITDDAKNHAHNSGDAVDRVNRCVQCSGTAG
jgi:hypothetical protein